MPHKKLNQQPSDVSTKVRKKLDTTKTVSASAEKRIKRLAEKAAEKASKTENNYDKDHSLFTK